MKLKCSLHSSEQNVAEILYKSFNYFYYEVPYLYDVKLHECIQNLTIVTVGPVGGWPRCRERPRPYKGSIRSGGEGTDNCLRGLIVDRDGRRTLDFKT